MHQLITSTKSPKNGVFGISFYVQSGVDPLFHIVKYQNTCASQRHGYAQNFYLLFK